MGSDRIQSWHGMSPDDCERLRVAIEVFGVMLLGRAKGPMQLWLFAERVAMHSGVRVLGDPGPLSDAIKELIWTLRHSRLRLIAPSMPGVGYVYDFENPETWPIGVGHWALK